MEHSAGGIIINNGKIALILQENGRISFPKGHKKDGEEVLATAVREIWEEAGLEDIELITKLGTYVRPHNGNPTRKKMITLYLFRTGNDQLSSIELNTKPFWEIYANVSNRLSYDEDKAFFNSHHSTISQHLSNKK